MEFVGGSERQLPGFMSPDLFSESVKPAGQQIFLEGLFIRKLWIVMVAISMTSIVAGFMHQSIPRTNIPPPPPGRPPGFCTPLLPRGRDLYLMTFPGGRVLHIHKITFSTVKKYNFTQLAFGSYLHALHRQFRLSILA